MVLTIFDPVFIGMVLLIIYMYKRIKNINTIDAIKMGLIDTCRGVVLGVIASNIIVKAGVVIPFKYNLLILVPTAVMLMLVDVKWGCFSYIIPIIYCVDTIFDAMIFKSEFFKLPFKELIILVGVLHLLEGVLVFLHGHETCHEVPIYKDGKLIKAKSSNKFWPIPLVIFKVAGGGILIPIYGILGYGDIAFYKTPKQKAKYMGILLLSYGSIVSVVGITILKGYLPLIIGMSIMPICHELLFVLSERYDKRH